MNIHRPTSIFLQSFSFRSLRPLRSYSSQKYNDVDLSQIPRRQTRYQIPYSSTFQEHHQVLDYPLKPTARIKLPSEEKYVTVETPFNRESLATLAATLGIKDSEIENMQTTTVFSKFYRRQTAKGSLPITRCLTIIGNGDGLFGYGYAKSSHGKVKAASDSEAKAIKNIKFYNSYRNRTVFSKMTVRKNAHELLIFPRPPGFGLRCHPIIRKVCQALGIKDISVKIINPKTLRPLHIVKAFLEGLELQKSPEIISLERGKRLIDLDAAYFSDKLQ